MSDYQLSWGEYAELCSMFETEVKIRGIKFPCDETKDGALLDFVSQYEEDQETDPHINCLEGVTCEREVHEINWEEIYA